MITTIIQLVMGIILLLSGRRLYWLFVGVIGFVAGVWLATILLSGESEWTILAISFAAGVVGSVLALLAQKLAVGIAGFFAGGYFVIAVFNAFDIFFLPEWVLFLIGGVIGVGLVAALFDFSLAALSSMAGAALIVQTLNLPQALAIFLLIFLLVMGIGFQMRILRQSSS